MIAEEQVHIAGWGATVISQLAMRGVPLKRPPTAISLPDDLLVPYSPALEDQVIPSVDAIAAAIRQACG